MDLTFAVDSNNDLFIGNDGNLALAVDLQALLQACEQAVKTQLGEMILTTNQGLPNFQTLWNGSPNIPQWEAALRVTILAVNGVLAIQSLTTGFSNNVISYVATIQTVYGTGAINGGL